MFAGSTGSQCFCVSAPVFVSHYPAENKDLRQKLRTRERASAGMTHYDAVRVSQFAKEKKELREKVKRREWTSAGTTDVNAYYSQKVNGLFIPAAVLQEPFFSADFPSARNAGGLGAVLGHEM